MAEWTFISNHGAALLFLTDKPEATTREIAHNLGITERTAQRIVSELYSTGYIERERVGRKNRYRVNYEKPLRHPAKRDKTVANFMTGLTNR